MLNGAIGIFDSGVGGLSIWREIVKLLPWENTIYLADQGYFPYGEKTDKKIRERAKIISQFLIDQGASLVVVACNTATVSAISYLRSLFSQAFVGVEPAIKPAAKESKAKEITVFATPVTLRSHRQQMLIKKHAQGTLVHLVAAPQLVQLVEHGKTSYTQTKKRLKVILSPKNIGKSDCIVLASTHYLFLKEAIQRGLGEEIKIYDPALPVAMRVLKLRLRQRNRQGRHKFFTTKDGKTFQQTAENLLGKLTGPVFEVNL